MMSFLGIALGIFLPTCGGTLLVRGDSEIAARRGTSSPELVVNVIGSNISNSGLVSGAAAIMGPIAIQGDIVRRELPLLLLATTMMAVLALDRVLEGTPAALGRTDAIVLMLMLCIFIYITAMDLMRTPHQDPLLVDIRESSVVNAAPNGRFSRLLFPGGFGGLPKSTAGNVSGHVKTPGKGTGMPEPVASVTAAVGREFGLALGNVIGSNIFNSLMVLPVSGVIARTPIRRGGISGLVAGGRADTPCPLREGLPGPCIETRFVVVYFVHAAFRILSS